MQETVHMCTLLAHHFGWVLVAALTVLAPWTDAVIRIVLCILETMVLISERRVLWNYGKYILFCDECAAPFIESWPMFAILGCNFFLSKTSQRNFTAVNFAFKVAVEAPLAERISGKANHKTHTIIRQCAKVCIQHVNNFMLLVFSLIPTLPLDLIRRPIQWTNDYAAKDYKKRWQRTEYRPAIFETVPFLRQFIHHANGAIICFGHAERGHIIPEAARGRNFASDAIYLAHSILPTQLAQRRIRSWLPKSIINLSTSFTPKISDKKGRGGRKGRWKGVFLYNSEKRKGDANLQRKPSPGWD